VKILRSYSKCKDVSRMQRERSYLIKCLASDDSCMEQAVDLCNIESRLETLGIICENDLWINKGGF